MERNAGYRRCSDALRSRLVVSKWDFEIREHKLNLSALAIFLRMGESSNFSI